MTSKDEQLFDLALGATGLEWEEHQSAEDIVVKVLSAVSSLPDEEWEELDDEVCEWYNNNARLVSSAETRKKLAWPSGKLVSEKNGSPPKRPKAAVTGNQDKAKSPKAQAQPAKRKPPPPPKAADPTTTVGGICKIMFLDDPHVGFDAVQDRVEAIGKTITMSTFQTIKYETWQLLRLLQARKLLKKDIL